MRPRHELRGSCRLLLVLGAVLLAGPGCANVVYRGPVTKIGEDTRNRKVLKERLDLEIRLDRETLSPFLTVRPVRVAEVKAERRSLFREYGYYIPFDPLVKAVEFVSFPAYLGLGIVLVYRYWTFDATDGGVGVGMCADRPGRAVALEDTAWRGVASHLDDVVRDPSRSLFEDGSLVVLFAWWELLGEVLSPWHNARFPFNARERFGPVGSVIEGPWRESVEEERTALTDRAPRILVGGAPAKAGTPRPGEYVLDLRELGDGPLEVRAEFTGADGKPVSRTLSIPAEELEAFRRAESLRQTLSKRPEAVEAWLELARLSLRHGSVEAAAASLVDASRAGVGSEALAPEWEALYASAAAKAFQAEPRRAYFTDALRAFHGEILAGSHREWPEAGRPSDRFLVEGLGAESFLRRARTAVLAAEREDIPAWQKNAALLAVLREDGHPIVRWACLWALERCGEGVADAVEGVGKMSEDPFIRARARSAAKSIRAREERDDG